MALVSVIPTLTFALLFVALAALGVPVDEWSVPAFHGPKPLEFLGTVIFSPIVETLLMGPVFLILSLATKNRRALAIASALVWAGLHSAVHPAWGLLVAWPFFVNSCAYLAWRPSGWRRAFSVTARIHALHNLVPACFMLFVE